MKLKSTFLLATFVVTMGLVLGASTAQAVNVITDGDGNVTRIENLPVVDETTEEPTIYNVDFRYESAIDVYGSDLVTDFPPPDGDETIILALKAVLDALNAEDPTPPGAGSEGTDQFFIGYKEEDGVFVSVGGENFSGAWDFCATDCINVGEIKTGISTMPPGDSFTYADFTVADDVAPGKATLISPSGTIDVNTPTYTWNAVASSTWYRLQVNDSSGAKTIYEWYEAADAGCDGGTGECSVTPSTELAEGAVKWWIQTWNDAGDGPWSDVMSFTVNTDTVDPGVNVETDGDGNVTRITNLPVVDENTGDTTIYDVDFVFDTATDVYGSGLNFDFPDDETIIVALNAVMDALNFADPTPGGAGPQGSDDFFIGHKEEDGLVVAVGGENFSGVWDPCATNCINVGEIQTGVTLLPPGDSFTYAAFTEAD